ncbi:MAG: cation:proton antiporter [Thermoplasmata archaeon]
MDLLFLILGLMLFLAFIGGKIMDKISQPHIIGYLLFGLLLSPSLVDIFLGNSYNYQIQSNIGILNVFSEIGIIILLFFIGLNISYEKFIKTTKISLLIGLIDISIMFGFAFLISYLYKWNIYESIIFGFILSSSSVVVTAKNLEETNKLSDEEIETLLNMLIMEDIISIIMFVLFYGFVNTNFILPGKMYIEYLGLFSLIVFVLFLSWIFLPYVKIKFFSNKNEELFTVLILSIIFLISELIEIFNINPSIGAFFAGLLFAKSDYVNDINKLMKPLEYSFGSIFFVSYGIFINIFSFYQNLIIIILSIIFILIGEFIIIPFLLYTLGFSSKGSIFIGSGLIARNEDALIFSNLSKSIGNMFSSNIMNVIYNVTGAIVLITTIISVPLMKYSTKINNKITKFIPECFSYPWREVSKFSKEMLFYKEIPIRKRNYWIYISLIIYGVLLLPTILFGEALFFILSTISLVINIFLLITIIIKHSSGSSTIFSSINFSIFLSIPLTLVYLYYLKFYFIFYYLLLILIFLIMEGVIICLSER